MQTRNPIVTLLLSLFTFGIYGIYWLIVTSSELKNKGADIPHWILMFVPFLSFYWITKYATGAEQVTNQKVSSLSTYILIGFLFPIGAYVAQTAYNEVSDTTNAAPVNNDVNYNNAAPSPEVATASTTTAFAAAAQPEPATFSPAPEPAAVAQGPVEPTPFTPPTVETPVVAPSEPVAFQPAEPVANPVVTPTESPYVQQPEQPITYPTVEPQQSTYTPEENQNINQPPASQA